MISKLVVIRLVIVIMGLLGMKVEVGEGRAPVLHEVGGNRFGWRLDVNFSEWAAHQHFYVGDWLYFGFDKQIISVLEVNQTGYKNCIESNYLTNITRGGRDVFNLTVDRPYYFISGRGYCNRGIKLAITVHDAPPDSSPPSSSESISKKSPTSIIISYATTTLFQPSDHFLIIMIITMIISLVWLF